MNGLHRITIHCEIDAGHRVVGHEGKCARLHGHRWQVDVEMAAHVLTDTGFVMDFGLVKDAINEWDHRMLLWKDDPIAVAFPGSQELEEDEETAGVVRLTLNPTSENLGVLLHDRLREVAPTTVTTIYVKIRETPGTSSSWGAKT